MLKRRRTPKPQTARQRHHSDVEEASASAGLLYNSGNRARKRNDGRVVDEKSMRSGQFWLQRFGLIILLIAIVISLFRLLSLSPNADIEPYQHNSATTLLFNKAQYQAAADKLLAGSIWNRNKITVDTAKISRDLLAEFPELANVSVTIPFLQQNPIIYIEPAQPAIIIRSSASGAFVLNENGKALLENTGNPIEAGQPTLPVVTDMSGLHLALGNQVLPASSVSFIQIVAAQLATKQYNITSMTLPPAASELDVYIEGKPYYIKFNLEDNDPLQQVGTFLATIAQLQSQNVTPTKYVDVRVDGRAYYQ
jgi:hypothetical protein